VDRESRRVSDVEQIEAIAQLDDGSDDGMLFDFRAIALGLLHGPLQGSYRPVLPKVDARTEPVVGVEAGIELLFAREHGVPQTAIAVMEG